VTTAAVPTAAVVTVAVVTVAVVTVAVSPWRCHRGGVTVAVSLSHGPG
jgi:hypothetical protein